MRATDEDQRRNFQRKLFSESSREQLSSTLRGSIGLFFFFVKEKELIFHVLIMHSQSPFISQTLRAGYLKEAFLIGGKVSNQERKIDNKFRLRLWCFSWQSEQLVWHHYWYRREGKKKAKGTCHGISEYKRLT